QLTYGPPPDGTGNQLAVPLTLYHYAFYGLYTLDAYGGIHPNGCQPLSGGPYWRGWRIARALALIPTHHVPGGYVLDGLGGLHPFSIGSSLPPPPMASAYWPGMNLARDVELNPGLSPIGGVTLDAWGGVHPFGSQPALAAPGPFWPYRD